MWCISFQQTIIWRIDATEDRVKNLKDEIKEIKAIKDKVLKRQKEEFLNQERIIEQENERQQKDGSNSLQELIQSIIKLQKEVKLAGTDGYDRHTNKREMKLDGNNRTKQRLLLNAKKDKKKLQMTPEKTKTSSWISEKKMKQR